jgi:hypothetical protein
MNNKIKLLLLSLGFGFISVQAHAQACNPCDNDPPPDPEQCPPNPGGPPIGGGFMAEDSIVDDVISAGAELEIAAPAAKIPTESSADSKPSAE